MMRLLNGIIICFLLMTMATTANAQHQAHKKKSHHVQPRHPKKPSKPHKKHRVTHSRVYKPQMAAPSDQRIELALPEKPPSGMTGFFSKPAASMGAVTGFVHKTVSNLKFSVYKLGGGHFEPSRGVYILDCSDYVDNILQAADPKAYSGLVHYMGTDRPTSQHYYDFFTELDEDTIQHGWTKITDVDDLLPGDVLVFRYKRGVHNAGGHVMIVMDKPIGDNDVYLVRVADSAASGHSHDTRLPNTSGIGIGTLLLKADPTSGRPSAYAWKVGAPFKSNVRIAMGRPTYSS